MPATHSPRQPHAPHASLGLRITAGWLLAVAVLAPAVVAADAVTVEADAVTVEADAVTVEADAVTVAAVQFEVSEEIYASPARFRAKVESLIVRAVGRFGADVVVFPEYVNVFLIAARYPGVIATADSLEEALAMIAGPDAGIQDLAAVFRASAPWIAEYATDMWSELADRHDTVVVAGTLFAPATGGPSPAAGAPDNRSDDGRTGDRRGEQAALRNRLLVFDESGALVYTQDKVYLTPYERDYLRLQAGTIRAAEPLVVDGLEVGFTICRDSFFEEWERELGGVDLWIALRANGEAYTREVYERFLRALPERVARTDAYAGINASLTGEFLGEVWAGPSYVVDGEGDRIAASPAPVGTRITAVRIFERGADWVPVPALPAD